MTVVRINNAYAWRYVCIVLSSFLHSCKIDVCQHFQFILDFVVVVDTVGQQHKKKKRKKKSMNCCSLLHYTLCCPIVLLQKGACYKTA